MDRIVASHFLACVSIVERKVRLLCCVVFCSRQVDSLGSLTFFSSFFRLLLLELRTRNGLTSTTVCGCVSVLCSCNICKHHRLKSLYQLKCCDLTCSLSPTHGLFFCFFFAKITTFFYFYWLGKKQLVALSWNASLFLSCHQADVANTMWNLTVCFYAASRLIFFPTYQSNDVIFGCTCTKYISV